MGVFLPGGFDNLFGQLRRAIDLHTFYVRVDPRVNDSVSSSPWSRVGRKEQRGGRGAVREIIEMILGAQGRWEEVVASYRG